MTLFIAEKGQTFLYFNKKNHLVLVHGPVEMFEDFINGQGENKYYN